MPTSATFTSHATSFAHSSPENPLTSPLSAARASVGEKRRRATENRKM